jgi:acetylornithine deacetylase/succinyl-diaminopimelate desuccinylase-like protein
VYGHGCDSESDNRKHEATQAIFSGAAMHGFNEYVDFNSLRKSTNATALFIAEWCGAEKV